MAEVTGEGRPTFAAEWLVEARDGGTCVVRLINSGFGSGAEWDAEYDATRPAGGCSCTTCACT